MQQRKIGIQGTATAAAVNKNNDVDAEVVAVDVVGMTNREKGLFFLRMFSWSRKENDLGFTQEQLTIKQLCFDFQSFFKNKVGMRYKKVLIKLFGT